jgi:hypothetical protein
MAIVEAISIPIGVTGQETVDQAANSYEDLGDAVAKTQREAERLANTFGINDDRTKEAIRVAGRYKQELEKLDFAIDGARGGVDTLFRATQGVVAGFELAAGAAAIFGSESEELQKILLKVQGALAFSQGLRDIKEFAPAILEAAKATRIWFVSLSFVQKAFLSLGIGLLIEGVIKLSDAFSSVSEETKKAADAQQDYNNKIKDLQLERIALQQGELVVSQIRLNDARAEQNKLLARNVEIQEQLARIRETERLLGDEFDVERRKALQQELKDNQLRVEILINDGLRLAKKIEELEAIKGAAITKTNTASEKELALQKAINAERRQTAKEMDEFIKKQNEVTGRGIENVTKVNEASIEQNDIVLNTIAARQISALEKAELFIGAYGEDLKNTFQQALYAIDALSQSFAGDDEARQKKAFDLSKKLSIVQTTIATIEATVQAYKEAQKNPLNQITAGAYAFTQAAIAASFGLAQIQQIRSQQFNGGTKPSVPSGSNASAVPRFNAPSTRIPGGGDEFTQVRRIYVTERDITNVQDKVRVTEGLSQF